ncbi:MAG: hypothetical protein RMJ28_02905 [Nitrososphaerota archaeon]|nr:hypothetical protein [Candidatus Calditenuaceae archaeon]MDW8073169.1 hypothetical protein [Nitrososphaerota archaeon]
MDSVQLIDALVVGGSLAALIASILAIYMVTLSLRVYRLTLTAYTNIRDALMQMAIQAAEKAEEQPSKPPPSEEKTPQSEAKPTPSAAETPARHQPYASLSELVSGGGFKAALIFDDSGQVIDLEGSIDADREAALLAEIINTVQLARSSMRSLRIHDGDLDVLIPATEMVGRKIYLYVRAPKEMEKLDIGLLSESARKILRNLLGGG